MIFSENVLRLMITKSAWFKHRQLTRYSATPEVKDYQEALANNLINTIKNATDQKQILTIEDLYYHNENSKLLSTIYNTIDIQLSVEKTPTFDTTLVDNLVNQETIDEIIAVAMLLDCERETIDHFKKVEYLIRSTDILFRKEPDSPKRQYLLKLLDPEFYIKQVLLHAHVNHLILNKGITGEWLKNFSKALNL